jgi:site-specific recombinase XerD
VETAARKLGLPAGQSQRGWTVHLFRHCLQSYAVNKGVPQRAVDVWFGHLGHPSTSRQYYHLGSEESLRLMQQLKFPTPDDITPTP